MTDDDFTIIIEDIEPDILLLETSFINDIGVLEIEKYDIPSVNIYTGFSALTVSDLPDIPVDKIIGLDDYLDDYLADYTFEIEEIDCGTP
jgi:hypothetical protein